MNDDSPDTSPCHDAPVSAKLAYETVLVVDEQPAGRARLRRWLERDGYHVVEADDIAAALARQGEAGAAVVLMDAATRALDGFQDVGGFELLPADSRPAAMLLTSARATPGTGGALPLDWPSLRERVRRGCAEHRVARRVDCISRLDALTGLPNRSGFRQRLEQLLDAGMPQGAVLLCVDLDGFRVVNDTLGHAAGDRLLHSVAERLGSAVPAGAMLARLGDDEFMVLLPGAGGRREARVVERTLRETLARPVMLRGQEVFVRASIGVALHPQDGTDAATLMRNADTALHRSKSGGRNTTSYYDTTMAAELLARMSMESGLRRGLEQGDFTLDYQPLVSLQTGELRSLEALVRWDHPRLGRIPPSDFIPLAEDTGLIHRLGAWVLETACAQVCEWRGGLDYAFSVAVNVSGRQFEDPDLVGSVRTILDRAGLDPQYLELELTENVVMRDVDRSIAMMGELKRLGIRISVDDFGTGYSSLGVLKRLPLDVLKIDRSFVGNLPAAEDDCAIVRAIVAMAHSLRLEVVAEGVQTAEQLEFLRGVGCECVQGFHVGRPADAGATAALVAAGRTLIPPAASALRDRPVVIGRERVFRC